ncbi:MAG: hypothetical protein ACOYJY_04060 [Acutalibacteraceae bacterium]|jgi:hypothetical protein
MKKLVSVLLVAVLTLAVLCVGVSAEAGLNSAEESVIAKLNTQVVNASGNTVFIPASYVNQAQNFFVSSVDMTDAQAEQINAIIDKGIAIVKANSGTDIAAYPYEAKAQILRYGQEAVAVLGMTLTYDGTNVVIVDANGKVAFSDKPILKTTGSTTPSAIPAAAVAAVLVVVMAAGVVSTKKLGLAK